MEKIQAAIAKARAARDGEGPTLAAPMLLSPQPEAKLVGTANWDVLQSCDINPERLTQSRIVTLSGASNASPFDAMRTKLLQTMRTNKWRRLAITSPSPACGKSTVALNLAFSLARQSDVRTIVTELDLRRPSFSKILDITSKNSIVDVLEGRIEFAQHAQRYGQNLAFAMATYAVRNPAELLQSGGAAERLALIEKQYEPDIIIFDMPPMLVCDDMMAFANQVDCVLLIAGAETTTIKEIDTCERELASQTNVMGVVLNKCRYMGADYGYSYAG